MSRVALGPMTFLRLLSRPEAVKRARDEVVASAREWDLDEDVLETLRLLVSEMVTNTLHVAENQIIEVRAVRGRECVVLDVWDPSPPIFKGDAPLAMPEAGAESGRGLPLVELMSSTWHEQPSTERSGKHLIVHVPLGAKCGCSADQ